MIGMGLGIWTPETYQNKSQGMQEGKDDEFPPIFLFYQRGNL
jgi:hypothetical protein